MSFKDYEDVKPIDGHRMAALTPSRLLASAVNSPSSSVFDLPAYGQPIARRPTPPTPRMARTFSIGDLESDGPSLSYTVVSGGTGCNAICSAFGENATYVLPVSDDGGSSSEIIRVMGGPSIGDIRSRLIRLIPPAPPQSPSEAIRKLLAYRFPSTYTEREARETWRDIVEGRSILWRGIPADRKETIRGFLVYFESELLKRAHKNFSFRNGSLGNYFLASCQFFFRSLPSAIFLFSSITGSQAQILPVLVTNHTVTIAAELENGRTLVGQCEISHPVKPIPSIVATSANITDDLGQIDSASEAFEEPIKGPTQNVMFEKGDEGRYEELESRIQRVFYINTYGQEIFPSPNPAFVASLNKTDMLVYSCGSLWTSIIPCLAIRGVASAIARSSTLRAKVLLLNAHNDRETSGYTAADYVKAIANTLNRHDLQSKGAVQAGYPISAFVTHLVYLRGAQVTVDEEELTSLGVKSVMISATKSKFDSDSVQATLERIARDEI